MSRHEGPRGRGPCIGQRLQRRPSSLCLIHGPLAKPATTKPRASQAKPGPPQNAPARCDAAAAAVLEVRADNGGALALYAAHGFGEGGRRRRDYPDGCDALLMERPPGPLKGG